MKEEKGQMKIVLGIVVLLTIIGVVLGFQFFGKGGFFGGKEFTGGPETTVASPNDNGSPLRSQLLPSGTLPAGTKQTKISVTINEPGYCRYSKEPGRNYDSMSGSFSRNKEKTVHVADVTGLKDGQTYKYYVRCRDLADNKNIDDVLIVFTIGSSSSSTSNPPSSSSSADAPPLVTNPLPTGSLAAGTRQTKISVTTNESAYCRYSTKSGQVYDSMSKTFSSDKDKLHHTADVTGLLDNRIYEYYVRCRDMKGNKTNEDVLIRFGVGGANLPTPSPSGGDSNPPQRYDASPAKDAELPTETRQTTISLKTDEKATCKYSTVSGMSYDSMNNLFSETNGTSHSTLVTGLSEGKTYTYYVKCKDLNNNKNTNDFTISFEVKELKDVIPPERKNPYPSGDNFPAGTKEAMASIVTNEAASCRYHPTQGIEYSSMRYSFSADKAKTYHTAKITGLQNGKSYEYFIRCKDLAGNVNTGDVMISFRVAAQ